jgi:hypothetical protein
MTVATDTIVRVGECRLGLQVALVGAGCGRVLVRSALRADELRMEASA